jgi:hypothetical protein
MRSPLPAVAFRLEVLGAAGDGVSGVVVDLGRFIVDKLGVRKPPT